MRKQLFLLLLVLLVKNSRQQDSDDEEVTDSTIIFDQHLMKVQSSLKTLQNSKNIKEDEEMSISTQNATIEVCPYMTQFEEWIGILQNHSENIESLSNNSKIVLQELQDGKLKASLMCLDSAAQISKWSQKGLQKAMGSLENKLNQCDKEFKESITAELTLVKMAQQDLKSTIEKVDEDIGLTIKDLKTLISTEFSNIKTQLNRGIKETAEMVSFCLSWRAKVGSWSLQTLSTGVYFYDTDSSVNYVTANRSCISRGMHLPIFESLLEMKVVAENAPNRNHGVYWVGACDSGFAPGDFHWRNGAKVGTEYWANAQPNNFGLNKEACAALYSHPNYDKLDDVETTTTWSFICKVDPEYMSCV